MDAAFFIAQVEKLIEDIGGRDFEAELLFDGFDFEYVDEIFVHENQLC